MLHSRFSWGPAHLPDGSIQFRLWAPAANRVWLVLEGQPDPIPLAAQPDGWHSVTTSRAHFGSRYRFQLGDGVLVPDPASRFQPEEALGPSEIVDPAFQWRDRAWRGMPWHTSVIQEVHVGAYTPTGTFAALAAKIPHLADVGITALQLMPIAEFPGAFDWGYEGVLPYAPHSAYGRPDQLKALIDKAHDYGVMVFLDIATERHTPWGAAMSFDDAGAEPVRRFFIESALHWLEEFHVDGLRLNAPDRLIDRSQPHVLAELAREVRDRFPNRHIHLMLAGGNKDPALLMREPNGHCRYYTAQWSEAALTPDASTLSRVLSEGSLAPSALISYLQNHAQIGDQARGERLTHLSSQAAVRASSAILLLLPQIPLLFMGEEWESTDSFPRFSKREEFQRARLDWSALRQPDGAAAFDRYQRLITLRRDEISPRIPSITQPGRAELLGEHSFRMEWSIGDAERLVLEANLSDHAGHVVRKEARRVLWTEGESAPGRVLPPWGVLWGVRPAS